MKARIISAKAEINYFHWIPACAGMTKSGCAGLICVWIPAFAGMTIQSTGMQYRVQADNTECGNVLRGVGMQMHGVIPAKAGIQTQINLPAKQEHIII